MANKRKLKQGINQVCETLFAECVAASLYGNEPHQDDNAKALLFSIIRMQADYTARISHPEPGLPPSQFYKALRESFTAQVGDMVDQINNL